jgi:hypothetical protein
LVAPALEISCESTTGVAATSGVVAAAVDWLVSPEFGAAVAVSAVLAGVADGPVPVLCAVVLAAALLSSVGLAVTEAGTAFFPAVCGDEERLRQWGDGVSAPVAWLLPFAAVLFGVVAVGAFAVPVEAEAPWVVVEAAAVGAPLVAEVAALAVLLGELAVVFVSLGCDWASSPFVAGAAPVPESAGAEGASCTCGVACAGAAENCGAGAGEGAIAGSAAALLASSQSANDCWLTSCSVEVGCCRCDDPRD